MLSFFKPSFRSLSLARFFSRSINEIEKECDKILDKVVRPILQKDGSDVVFHGIKDGCAIITLEGEAGVCDCDECANIPKEILQIFQQYLPEITSIRKKLDYEE